MKTQNQITKIYAGIEGERTTLKNVLCQWDASLLQTSLETAPILLLINSMS